MNRARRLSRLADGLRDLAAIVGTLPVAVLMCIGLARALPFDEPTRLAEALTLGIPVWVAAMILTFIARTARCAWAFCVVSTAVLGVCLLR